MNALRELLGALRRAFSDWARHRRGLALLLLGIRRLVAELLGRRERPPRRREGEGGECCVDLPPDVRRRPDPLLYSQPWLMSMGVAVTWDNPDIQLFERDPTAPDGLGAAVSSSDLKPNHAYRVQVRVWNGSYHAPAPGLPVHLSFLTFGASTTSTPIAVDVIDLGVKGGAHHPAFALFDWLTPPVAGHYCLQARLVWADDANPANNLGQENVEVGVAHSPAVFRMALRNAAGVTRRFILQADGYRLPVLPTCGEAALAIDAPRDRALTRIEESRMRWQRALREQGYGQHPVPEGVQVAIDPAELSLEPFADQIISIAVEPAATATDPIPINVNAFALGSDGGREFVGGVTVYAARA